MIRLLTLSLVDAYGEVATFDLSSHATEIIGERNTGKSTIFRIIDYMFGDTDSAAKAYGAEVAERYRLLRLELLLGDAEHLIERRPNDQGYAGKVICDGTELRADAFSDWILGQLEWPSIRIPKGLDPKAANTTIALTFRNLLRHIYRGENSWSDLAYKEQEIHRRAVVKYFLGILDDEAALGEFDLARADRDVEALAARLDEAKATARHALEAVAHELNLAVSSWEEADEAIEQLQGQIESVRQQQQAIASDIRSLEAYNSEQTAAYERLSTELVASAAALADLEAVARTYRESVGIVQGEITRLERANTSIDVFANVPVTECPACGQNVTEKETLPAHCFLCALPVTEDNRKRRVTLEIRALRDEEAELLQQLELTDHEVAEAVARRDMAKRQRDVVGAQITDERSALLAPHVARLEALSAEAATHTQAIATLTGLRVIRGNAGALERKLQSARERREAIDRANLEREENTELATERCDRFAGWMNDFLSGLEVVPWTFGAVTLRPRDAAFLINGQPWQDRLGGETKVSFLFAYHYALLKLSDLHEPGIRSPGLVILDNPIQQGLLDEAVSEALQKLEECAAETQGSVVSAFARSLATHGDGKRVIRMTHEYGTELLELDSPDTSQPDPLQSDE